MTRVTRAQPFALRVAFVFKVLASNVKRGADSVCRVALELGPYFVLAMLLPGGLLLAPLLYLHRRRAPPALSLAKDDV